MSSSKMKVKNDLKRLTLEAMWQLSEPLEATDACKVSQAPVLEKCVE